jgi:hypothetical protein
MGRPLEAPASARFTPLPDGSAKSAPALAASGTAPRTATRRCCGFALRRCAPVQEPGAPGFSMSDVPVRLGTWKW